MAVVLNKNDIIQEANDIYMRLILLQQPPFILQSNSKYNVWLEELSNISYSVLFFEDESGILLDMDSLFFLSDGYIVSLISDDISQAKLYVLFNSIKYADLLSIADIILIPPLSSEYNYVELGDLNIYNGKEIKNYSGFNIKFSSGTISDFYNILEAIEDNKEGKLKKLFYFDELTLDDTKCVELVNSMSLSLNVNTLYLTNNQYWNIDFKNIIVNKIIISEGTIGISFSELFSHLDVVLPKSLKYIGQMSFNRCTLNSINLEDLEDFYIGNASFQSTRFSNDKQKRLDLSKCLYLGIEAFRSSTIKNVIVSNKTVIDTDSFYNSELKSFEVVNTEKQVLYNQKIYNDYIISLNDIILEDSLHRLTYYDFSNDTYSINKRLFMFCVNLSDIYIPCDKVIFNSKSISFVSPKLKISGMKEYTIRDINNTLLCKKWDIIDDKIRDYALEFIDEYIGNGFILLYEMYNMLVSDGYIRDIYVDEKIEFRDILEIILEVLIDYISNILSNSMEEDYYEYNVNITYINLRLIGKKSKPEVDLRKLVFDILNNWSRGYHYNEKEEFINNRHCNVNATVRL